MKKKNLTTTAAILFLLASTSFSYLHCDKKDSDSVASDTQNATESQPAQPASPQKAIPTSPARKPHAPSFSTPSPRKKRDVTVQVTPAVRSVRYNFDTPWPTNLTPGGTVTTTKAAACRAIQDTVAFRDWKRNREEPDFTQLGLWMHDRITDKLNDTLIKAIAEDRKLNPCPTNLGTPAKESLDHAFSYDMILAAIIRSRSASAYLAVDPKRKLQIRIIVPVDVTYNNIHRKHHLTSLGLVCLAFGYEVGSNEYTKLSVVTKSPKSPAGQAEMRSIALTEKLAPYYLYHACLHPNDAIAQKNNQYFVPVNVEFDYDPTWKAFYLNIV